jgi:hypothetical protein
MRTLNDIGRIPVDSWGRDREDMELELRPSVLEYDSEGAILMDMDLLYDDDCLQK